MYRAAVAEHVLTSQRAAVTANHAVTAAASQPPAKPEVASALPGDRKQQRETGGAVTDFRRNSTIAGFCDKLETSQQHDLQHKRCPCFWMHCAVLGNLFRLRAVTTVYFCADTVQYLSAFPVCSDRCDIVRSVEHCGAGRHDNVEDCRTVVFRRSDSESRHTQLDDVITRDVIDLRLQFATAAAAAARGRRGGHVTSRVRQRGGVFSLHVSSSLLLLLPSLICMHNERQQRSQGGPQSPPPTPTHNLTTQNLACS